MKYRSLQDNYHAISAEASQMIVNELRLANDLKRLELSYRGVSMAEVDAAFKRYR